MRERHAEGLLWRPSPLLEIARYAVAVTIVATLATGVALAVLRYRPDESVASDVDDAVLLDLPPAIDSSAPQRDVNEGPEQQAVASAASGPPAEIKPNPPAPTPPDATAEAPQEPREPKMDVPSAPRPEAAVIPPPKLPNMPPEDKPPEDRKPEPVKTEDAPPPSPPAATAAAQEETGLSGMSAPVKETEPTDGEAAHARAAKAISRWQRSMLARLQAAKSGMRTGGEIGAVEVGFSIDHTGAVVASRIIRGSGSPRLDQAALALVQRASPFSQPPRGLSRQDLAFKVPIIFALHK